MEASVATRLAKHPGRCGVCRKPIVPNVDEIVFVSGRGWTHDYCMENEHLRAEPEQIPDSARWWDR